MWPFNRRTDPAENRSATGGYTGIISALIDLQAAGTTQQASATAATEAVAGALSRAFADATVDAPPDIMAALSPRTLAQIGRDLVRVGESLHVIRMSGGRLRLFPASTWYWEGEADPADWLCTATVYGPSGSSTWRLPQSSVVFATWGSPTARPYHGLSPGIMGGGHVPADRERRAIAGERSGAGRSRKSCRIPRTAATSIPPPSPMAPPPPTRSLGLKADIAKAKGNALLLETTAGGWDQGAVNAPRSDLETANATRAGCRPEAMVKLAESAFARSLAAAGCSPSLFNDADGTSKREALRHWHLGVVRPLAKMLESELSEKFGTPVRLKFDNYALDQVSRAQVFAKLAAVEGVSPAMAMALAQIGDGDE